MAVQTRTTILVFLLSFLICVYAKGAEQEKVGNWHDTSCFIFEGLQTFTSDEIIDGLSTNPEFILAAHPEAPLSEYIKTIQGRIITGYLRLGFPRVTVQVALHEERNQIQVKVEEGLRFICGDIIVSGAPNPPKNELIERLTPPDTPAWKKGEPAPFDKTYMESLKKRVKEAISEFGYYIPNLEINIQENPKNNTADLLINIKEPGPKAILKNVEVLGSNKNKKEEIITYLGLKIGAPIDQRVVKELQDKLLNSARFLAHDVKLNQDKDGVELIIEVTEYDKAPNLTQEFSEEEKALLNMKAWLMDFFKQQEALTVKHTSNSSEETTVLALSPSKGLFIRINNQSLNHALIISPEMLALFSMNRKLHLAYHKIPLQMFLNLSIKYEPRNIKTPFFMSFSTGVRTQEDNEIDRSIEVNLDIAPVAMIGIANVETNHCKVSNGLFTLTHPSFELKTNAESGRILELKILKEQGFIPDDLRIVFEKGAFDHAYNSLKEQTSRAFCESAADFPISTMIRFLLEEAYYKTNEGFIEILSRIDFTSIDSLFQSELEWCPVKFSIPTEFPMPDNSLVATGIRAAASIIYGLFPRNSWPCTLAQESVCVVFNRPIYTGLELERLYKSEKMGPLGFLCTAKLLQFVNPQNAMIFASMGLKKLSTNDFKKDCSILLDRDSKISRFSLNITEVLVSLKEEEIKALAEGIDKETRRLFITCICLLKEGTPKALDELWEKKLRSLIKAELQKVINP